MSTRAKISLGLMIIGVAGIWAVNVLEFTKPSKAQAPTKEVSPAIKVRSPMIRAAERGIYVASCSVPNSSVIEEPAVKYGERSSDGLIRYGLACIASTDGKVVGESSVVEVLCKDEKPAGDVPLPEEVSFRYGLNGQQRMLKCVSGGG